MILIASAVALVTGIAGSRSSDTVLARIPMAVDDRAVWVASGPGREVLRIAR